MEKEIRVNVFHPTKPHEGQLQVLRALDSGERFVLLRAGRKWRKTSLIISWLIEKALETGLTSPYIAPNRVQAKNIAWNDHIQRVLNHFAEKGLKYKKNEVELSVTFPNNGKLQLLGVENREALRGISNWGAVGCDEYDDWAEDIWPTIIRPNLMTHKAPALVAGTPKGYRNMYRLERSGLFTPFHFSSHQNPDLDPKELEDLVEEYKQMGDAYYRQEILAEYERPVGAVYKEWEMNQRYIPFEYDPNLPVHLSWDFGINDPTCILFMQPNGSEIRIFDYYEASNADLSHFVNYISAKPYAHAVFEAGDVAGNARELTSGKSPVAELTKYGHHIRTSTIPSIQLQIRHMHRFLNRIYVSSSNPACERVVHCFMNYRYPDRKESLLNQSNEVPVHDEYSHCMRALEYYFWNLHEPSKKLESEDHPQSINAYLKRQREKKLLQKEGYVGY
jgi:hypothetical protein